MNDFMFFRILSETRPLSALWHPQGLSLEIHEFYGTFRKALSINKTFFNFFLTSTIATQSLGGTLGLYKCTNSNATKQTIYVAR